EAIFRNGIEYGSYQQIDDTGARVNGDNQHVQIICNPSYSAYFTTANKDRLTIIDLFNNFAPRQYIYNQEVQELLSTFNISIKMQDAVEQALK
ncbi:unnamed protein product, partial [marine sediment metagenome]